MFVKEDFCLFVCFLIVIVRDIIKLVERKKAFMDFLIEGYVLSKGLPKNEQEG